jgi:hypothetical protein
VRLAPKAQVRTFHTAHEDITVTYDSEADGNYISKNDIQKAGLPILRRSTRRVSVANGEVSTGTNVITLPMLQLPKEDTEGNAFDNFLHSLMSADKTSGAGTISIFRKDGLTVHKEDNVMITCKGTPIMIGARDMHGRYKTSLIQQKDTWQTRKP